MIMATGSIMFKAIYINLYQPKHIHQPTNLKQPVGIRKSNNQPKKFDVYK